MMHEASLSTLGFAMPTTVGMQKQDLQYLEPKAHAQMIRQNNMAPAKLLTTTDDGKLESGIVKLMYDGRESLPYKTKDSQSSLASLMTGKRECQEPAIMALSCYIHQC